MRGYVKMRGELVRDETHINLICAILLVGSLFFFLSSRGEFTAFPDWVRWAYVLAPSVIALRTKWSVGVFFSEDGTVSIINTFWKHKLKATDIDSFRIGDEVSFGSQPCEAVLVSEKTIKCRCSRRPIVSYQKSAQDRADANIAKLNKMLQYHKDKAERRDR